MKSEINVIEIKLNEIEQAANVLANAFKNDPLMQWIFGDNQSYEEKSMPIYKTWVKYAVLYGKAIRTNQFEAVALRKKPGDLKEGSWRLFRSGMLKTPSIMGQESFDRLMEFHHLVTEERKKQMGNKLFWYCWMLGTNPAHQKMGFGGALVRYTERLQKETNLPCYLETASTFAIQVHLRHGFKVLSETPLPQSDIVITAMLRESA